MPIITAQAYKRGRGKGFFTLKKDSEY